eukprot:jgi/Ulvmu1/10468/UM064_0005.1
MSGHRGDYQTLLNALRHRSGQTWPHTDCQAMRPLSGMVCFCVLPCSTCRYGHNGLDLTICKLPQARHSVPLVACPVDLHLDMIEGPDLKGDVWGTLVLAVAP